jgi:hypothetical protein
MLVTLFPMVTLVKVVLKTKVAFPIAIVGNPPSVSGIEIVPPAPVYPVIVAFPPDTV